MTIGFHINTTKSVALVPFGELLGHIVLKHGVATDPDKTTTIFSLIIPTTITKVKGCLEHIGYYPRFMF